MSPRPWERGNGPLTARLAGNPNVGKSTVFNALTGLNQHTGNWAGKTVQNAVGQYVHQGTAIRILDIPGAYSLLARSEEERVARDCICFGQGEVTVIVCDATALPRNLNLVLQTLEVTGRTVVCVNLLDEAARRGIALDLPLLSARLGAPVVGVCARRKQGLGHLSDAIIKAAREPASSPVQVVYPPPLEAAADQLSHAAAPLLPPGINPRWAALRLLEGDPSLLDALNAHLGFDLARQSPVAAALSQTLAELTRNDLTRQMLPDVMVSAIFEAANRLLEGVIHLSEPGVNPRQLRLDRLLTGRLLGAPLMMLLLALVFYLTIAGANLPSQWLFGLFAKGELLLSAALTSLHAPPFLVGLVCQGMFRTLGWVIAVMLPPMAIFFPLFTLLEDLGYLPRMAFNLDRRFCRCGGCGKQALTMCMGFGCNAAGVTGCRIIDSPRERLIAILTNSFVPCNGRFPALIALITMGLARFGAFGPLMGSLLLTLVVLLGIGLTFAAGKLLSKTLLRGVPSSFTLELPPFRKPQVAQVLVRSLLDRTLFVLGRAAAVAAPAGAVIYLLANLSWGGGSLLQSLTSFLDPLARPFGLDGVLLSAFLLGLPANEIVLPIAAMAYGGGASLASLGSLNSVGALLAANGWTGVTYLCATLFMLLHWPCSTTLLTIRKETGSVAWTALAALLPTAFGLIACLAVNVLHGLILLLGA